MGRSDRRRSVADQHGDADAGERPSRAAMSAATTSSVCDSMRTSTELNSHQPWGRVEPVRFASDRACETQAMIVASITHSITHFVGDHGVYAVFALMLIDGSSRPRASS